MRRTFDIFFLVLAVVATASVIWAFIEARLLPVSRAAVTHPQVPEGFDGLRIAFVSDIHSGSVQGRQRTRDIIDAVNALHADVVVLGGDHIGGGDHGAEWFYPEASRLRAPMGVCAVLGNHEGRWGADDARSKLPKAGILLLENESVRLRRGGDSIRLSGVADLRTGDPDLRAVAEGTPANGYSIVVSHDPDALVTGLPKTSGAFDLALSGHTHGGQITLFGLWAPVVPSSYGQRFVHGWTTVDGVPTLVSRGAGTFILPMRFFAPPEIHLLTLHKGPAHIER